MATKLAAYWFKICYSSKNLQISSYKVECYYIQFDLTESKLHWFGVFGELRSNCVIFDIQRYSALYLAVLRCSINTCQQLWAERICPQAVGEFRKHTISSMDPSETALWFRHESASWDFWLLAFLTAVPCVVITCIENASSIPCG